VCRNAVTSENPDNEQFKWPSDRKKSMVKAVRKGCLWGGASLCFSAQFFAFRGPFSSLLVRHTFRLVPNYIWSSTFDYFLIFQKRVRVQFRVSKVSNKKNESKDIRVRDSHPDVSRNALSSSNPSKATKMAPETRGECPQNSWLRGPAHPRVFRFVSVALFGFEKGVTKNGSHKYFE